MKVTQQIQQLFPVQVSDSLYLSVSISCMKKYFFILSVLFAVNTIFAQQKPAYVLYDANGKKVSYKKMMKQLAKKDIVLFGEFHNNPISHWLELTVAKDLKEKREIVFGAEMFVCCFAIIFLCCA